MFHEYSIYVPFIFHSHQHISWFNSHEDLSWQCLKKLSDPRFSTLYGSSSTAAEVWRERVAWLQVEPWFSRKGSERIYWNFMMSLLVWTKMGAFFVFWLFLLEVQSCAPTDMNLGWSRGNTTQFPGYHAFSKHWRDAFFSKQWMASKGTDEARPFAEGWVFAAAYPWRVKSFAMESLTNIDQWWPSP